MSQGFSFVFNQNSAKITDKHYQSCSIKQEIFFEPKKERKKKI